MPSTIHSFDYVKDLFMIVTLIGPDLTKDMRHIVNDEIGSCHMKKSKYIAGVEVEEREKIFPS